MSERTRREPPLAAQDHRMRALSYFVDEAIASLWRGYKTASISTLTIAVALFVFGGFLLVTSNMERLFARWQEAAEFSVYLKDNAPSGEQTAVQNMLRESGLVRAVEVVPKDEALRRFRQNFGDLAAMTGDLPDNPLPASIEVRLLPDANPAAVEALAARAAKLPAVADVQYDRRWIQRLMNAAALMRTGGLALAGVLFFAAALTVASVVRLALVARREEIHIMQLVGAPLAYIRGPFILEGLIQGGVGAIVAVVVLWTTFLVIRTRQAPILAGAINPATLVFLSLPMCVAVLAGGMVVGCIGGMIAARSTREIAD